MVLELAEFTGDELERLVDYLKSTGEAHTVYMQANAVDQTMKDNLGCHLNDHDLTDYLVDDDGRHLFFVGVNGY